MFSRLTVPLILISSAFAALTLVGRKYFSYFFFIFAYLFAVTMLFSMRARRLKMLLYNAAFAFLALCLFEGYLIFHTFSTGTAQWGTYTEGHYFTPDSIKGYGAPRQRGQYTSIKKRKTGELIYDITYTMDTNGLRITPDKIANTEHPVWFFGCSFTIGEGVKDEETLPYLFALKSDTKTYNFGFHGYGPHQMLRMLETTYIRDIDPKKPSLVFYNAISVHIERAAGLVSWDKDGPRYVINGDSVRYAGKFSDGNLIGKYADKIFDKSLIYSRLIRPLIFTVKDADRRLYIAIVKKSSDIVRDTYGSELVVVLWDVFRDRSSASDVDSNYIDTELTKRGIKVIRVSKVLGLKTYKQYYIPGDGHPAGVAFNKVADLLIEEMVKR